MAEVYTPGTLINSDMVIRKTRRLLLDGEVLVKVGQHVEHDTIVGRAKRPGKLATIRVAQQLSIEPAEIDKAMLVAQGDEVEADQVIAEHKAFFGLVTWRSKTPVSGTIELVSKVSGHVGIRQPAEPVEISAYLPGKVVEIIPNRGAVIESRAAILQGMFGIGPERSGVLKVLDSMPDSPGSDLAGSIIAIDDAPTADWLRKAAVVGVQGIICPTMDDHEIADLLGYQIGVAVTGNEQCGLTIVLAEGFGHMGVAPTTWRLLKALEGRRALISGATQVRAGVIRPELVVPYAEGEKVEVEHIEKGGQENPRVRILRAPYFGRTGRIIDAPVQPTPVETGANVRVFKVKLDDGTEALVPRTNVEVLG